MDLTCCLPIIDYLEASYATLHRSYSDADIKPLSDSTIVTDIKPTEVDHGTWLTTSPWSFRSRRSQERLRSGRQRYRRDRAAVHVVCQRASIPHYQHALSHHPYVSLKQALRDKRDHSLGKSPLTRIPKSSAVSVQPCHYSII